MEMYAEAIKKCRLFMNLPLAVIQRDILPMAHVQDISKGKYMIMYQDYVDYFGIIISGKVQIEGHIYPEGSIVLQHKNETSDFEVLEDTVIAVVKYPSSPGDKYDA